MKHLLLALSMTVAIASLAAAQIPIYDIQYTTDPSGDSPYAGQVVTTGGVVTAVHYDGFVMYEGAAPWQAVFVYTFTAGPTIGDLVEVTGTVVEYYGMTEINELSAFTIISHDHPVTPVVVDVADVSQEPYESVLLTVEDVMVTAQLGYGEWTLDEVLICNDTNDYLYFPQLDDELDSLTGTLFYSFGAFKLEPRFTADVAGDMMAHYALGGDVVTMNATRDVLTNHWIEIEGDQIVGIHDAAPSGIPTVATGGLIFPGLIDSHNHPQYNILGPIPFEELFEHRDEWRNHPLYDDFNDQRDAILDNPDYDWQYLNSYKLAEVRAMCSGTTTIQGANCNGHQYDPYARQGMGINNAERFPPRIFADTFPLWDSSAVWQARSSENWRRFVVHLCEGTNQVARDEFAAWQDLGMLDGRTTVIHGTALGEAEFAAMAGVEASLIWSPQSNLVLYGATTDIPTALAAGVNVALAPDWTESGSNDLLAEMKVAHDLSEAEWSGLLSSQMLAEMVTCNAVQALGMADIRGSIETGLRADLMVIPGSSGAPYDALLAANPVDVMLTVVDGRPGYGDPVLMDQFSDLADVEDISIGETTKRLALSITAHGIELSDQPFSTALTMLETAYETATPEVCCFRGLEVVDCTALDVPDPLPSLGLVSVHPNPFNPKTTVVFDLPRSAPVRLTVYDAAGREVRQLTEGRWPAGRNQVSWDGRDGRGRGVAGGVYLMRLTTPDEQWTAKVTLVK